MDATNFIAPGNVRGVSDQPGRRRGRPRTRADEAERSRAYRERKAAELGEPARLRAAAKAAQAATAQARRQSQALATEAQRWQRRAQAARRDAAKARDQARRARARAQRSTADRDDARRLLRRKLQWARRVSAMPGVRDDPRALLAIISELHQELARLRRERQVLHRLLRLSPEELAARQRAWQSSSRR